MARRAMIVKAKKKPKFKSRAYSRCEVCGRARGYMQMFKLCRICFRKYANEGNIPGIVKSSW